VLKASPASKKQRPHRQNEFSEHQNASNADALTGAGEFCKKLKALNSSSLAKINARFLWVGDGLFGLRGAGALMAALVDGCDGVAVSVAGLDLRVMEGWADVRLCR